MTTNRFTNPPEPESMNISVDHCLIHPKQKGSYVFQGALLETSETSPGPPDVSTDSLACTDPKRAPKDPRRPTGDVKC